MYTLSELSNDGHVYAEKKQLLKVASELLGAEEEYIIMTMDDMLKKEKLIQEKNIKKTMPSEEVDMLFGKMIK